MADPYNSRWSVLAGGAFEFPPIFRERFPPWVKRKREDILATPDYFMAVAVLAAKRSEDPNTQVGACIVNQENKIVGIGHNCMPKGGEGRLPWARDAVEELDNKYLYVCHAEMNAVINTNGADVKGCTIYVTLFPCNECAKLLIQAGIKKVVYLSDKYHASNAVIASRKMLTYADVKYEEFEPQDEHGEIVLNIEPEGARASQGLVRWLLDAGAPD